MKISVFYKLFIIISLVVFSEQKCDFQNEIPSDDVNILKLNITNKFHPLDIYYDYSIMENQIKEKNIEINKENLNIIKEYLSKAKNIIKDLFISSHEVIIKTKNKEICGEKYIYGDTLSEGIKADLIIFPILDNKNNLNDVNGNLCAIEKTKTKPIIGLLSLSLNITLINENSKDRYLLTIIHHLFHIIGFNKNVMEAYSFKKYPKKDTYGRFLIQTINPVRSALFITRKKDLYGVELSSSKNNTYDPHWTFKIRDIMNMNYIEYCPITQVTLFLLTDTHLYKLNKKSCNLIMSLNDKEDLIFADGNYTSNLYAKYLLAFFIYKRELRCYSKGYIKNVCYYENDFIKYYHLNLSEHSKTCKNENYTYENYLDDYPEVKDIESQELTLFTPPQHIVKCQQRYIYFKYPPAAAEIQNTSKLNLSTITLNSNQKEYFVNVVKYPDPEYECLHDSCSYNNLINVNNTKTANYIYNVRLPIPQNLFKYQKYFCFLTHYQITRKDLLYYNYRPYHMKFPNDFNYLPETFILPKDKEIFDKRMKNYKLSTKNLWLVKPPDSDQGKGIYIMEKPEDVCPNCIVNKYIAHPHLLNKKKYDLRVYVLVTSFNPLIVYVYKDGLVRLCVDDYTISLDTLKNLYIHLTNTSLNDKSEKFLINNDPDSEFGNTWTIKTLRRHFENEGFDFDEIMEGINDFTVKTLITMLDSEIHAQRKKNIMNDNNIFGLFGIDVLIDNHLKPWLIEFNAFPSFISYTRVDSIIKSKLLVDTNNILGITSYSHVTGKHFDGECYYKSIIDESVDRALAEFTRPSGGFVRAFPRKDNVDYYKKFFYKPSLENLALWDRLKKIEDL